MCIHLSLLSRCQLRNYQATLSLREAEFISKQRKKTSTIPDPPGNFSLQSSDAVKIFLIKVHFSLTKNELEQSWYAFKYIHTHKHTHYMQVIIRPYKVLQTK